MTGTQIVIPRVLRKDMLVKLHESILVYRKSENLAKDIMYWPDMNSQIEDYVSKCGICLENRSFYQKESMIPCAISELPRQVVVTYLFQWSRAIKLCTCC